MLRRASVVEFGLCVSCCLRGCVKIRATHGFSSCRLTSGTLMPKQCVEAPKRVRRCFGRRRRGTAQLPTVFEFNQLLAQNGNATCNLEENLPEPYFIIDVSSHGSICTMCECFVFDQVCCARILLVAMFVSVWSPCPPKINNISSKWFPARSVCRMPMAGRINKSQYFAIGDLM